MKLLFATNNQNKIAEVQALLVDKFELCNLESINCYEDLPETQATIEGNAMQKAWYVYNNYGVNCFADDTGLEVEALNGAPGVYSARYAGPERNAAANNVKLLLALKGNLNRKARFKTVIALVLNGKQFLFEGHVDGEITNDPSGEQGFGYDPVFKPLGYNFTFAEMPLSQKNSMSHRAKAVKKLVDYLRAI